MEQKGKASLKERILSEMLVNHENALERNYERAKNWLRLTTAGNVEVLSKSELTAQEQVSLYLIGKLYGAEAGLCEGPGVWNAELMSELGLPKGTLLPSLKALRDRGMIKRSTQGRLVQHFIAKNRVESVLLQLESKGPPSLKGGGDGPK